MPLPLPRAVATDLFRATIAIVQADEDLRRVVKTWDVMDGKQSSIKPPATQMMPWIRMMPGLSRMKMVEAASYGIDFEIYVQLATATLDADDSLNLWFAFCKALNYEAPFRGVTVAEYLHSLKCDVHEVSGPAFGPMPQPSPTGGSPAVDTFAAARVILRFRVDF